MNLATQLDQQFIVPLVGYRGIDYDGLSVPDEFAALSAQLWQPNIAEGLRFSHEE